MIRTCDRNTAPPPSSAAACSTTSRSEFSSVLLYQGPRQVLGYFGLKASHGDVTAQLPIPIQLGVAVLWGVAFIHYYLDSKIWRVRRDPSVGKALKMS